MKSEVIMPEIRRRRYTEEFKMEAMRLVRESARPTAQVARKLWIADNLSYCWVAEHWQAEAQDTTRADQRADMEELARVKRERCRPRGTTPGAGGPRVGAAWPTVRSWRISA